MIKQDLTTPSRFNNNNYCSGRKKRTRERERENMAPKIITQDDV